jgi:hypothetical protein
MQSSHPTVVVEPFSIIANNDKHLVGKNPQQPSTATRPDHFYEKQRRANEYIIISFYFCFPSPD